MGKAPSVHSVRVKDTHRLIPAKYNPDEASVLVRIAVPGADLHDLFDLDGATNDRLLSERDLLPGIDRGELVHLIPFASVINAAFCHASPVGGRFNSSDRGAWYAGYKLDTAQAEVAHNRAMEMAEIPWREEAVFTCTDYLANFDGDFHDIRGVARFEPCLAPDSYTASQALARELLDMDSGGIIYPSVRDPRRGTCMACFRPALVNHVRRGGNFRLLYRDGAIQGWI